MWRRNRTQANWGEYVVTRRHPQHVYVEAEQAFNERSRALLTNVPNPRKWWSTVKTEVYCASSSLTPLVERRGRLVWSADEKASLFSTHFDAKQYRDSFLQLHSCNPFPVLCSVVFKSSSIRSLLLDLDLYGGYDPDDMFPLFYKQVTRELAPKLAVIFRHLIKGGSFPECWKLADAVLVRKESLSSKVRDYIPISTTPLL